MLIQVMLLISDRTGGDGGVMVEKGDNVVDVADDIPIFYVMIYNQLDKFNES
jgi:hypothetical protein